LDHQDKRESEDDRDGTESEVFLDHQVRKENLVSKAYLACQEIKGTGDTKDLKETKETEVRME